MKNNKYKEELNRIHMSQELRQRILSQEQEKGKQEVPHHHYRKVFLRTGATLALGATILCIFLWPNFHEDPDASPKVAVEDNSTENKKQEENRKQDVEEEIPDSTYSKKKYEFDDKTGSADVIGNYTPQLHEKIIGGAGVMGKDTMNEDVEKYRNRNDYMEGIETLPAYRLQHVMQYGTNYKPSLSQKELMKIIQPYLDRFAITDASITTDTYLGEYSIMMTPEINKNSGLSKIKVLGNGDVELWIDVKTLNDYNDRKEIQTRAIAIYQEYKDLLPIKNPVWNTTCSLNSDVCHTKIYAKADTPEKELRNQGKQEIEFDFMDYGEECKAIITIQNKENRQKIKDYKVMTPNEAYTVLKSGGYYSMSQFAHKDLNKAELLSVQLQYDSYYHSFNPYIIPIYRFILQLESGQMIQCDVPAFYPETLEELNENTWYFK